MRWSGQSLYFREKQNDLVVNLDSEDEDMDNLAKLEVKIRWENFLHFLIDKRFWDEFQGSHSQGKSQGKLI